MGKCNLNMMNDQIERLAYRFREERGRHAWDRLTKIG
jgi:hypothetical protein